MRILCTSPLPASARARLEALGEVSIGGDGRAELAAAEILVVRGERVDARTLAAAPRLRVIARTGAGYDRVDVAAATARGIPVLYAPGAGTTPVAEGALALILAAAKRLGELGELVRAGRWTARYDVETLDLHGAVLGLVGLGSIGREVARLGRAFGMRTVAADPFVAADAASPVPLVSLDEVVCGADVISLHCALTEATRGLVDRRLLQRAKRGAILVNVARGAIVESEDVLLDALESGQLSAVGLDVFAAEPPDPAHPLLAHPRVVCTPHAVGLTARWNARVFEALVAGIGVVLAGGVPEHVVNPEVLARAPAPP